MPVRKTEQARRDAGLCLACGAERGDDNTKTRCSPCAEKARQATQRWRERHPEQKRYRQNPEKKRARRAREYAERVAAGICTVCGKTKLPAEETRRGLVNCATCRLRSKAKYDRSRQKKRDQTAGIPENSSAHWPSGERPVAFPEGLGSQFCCDLDFRANAALLNLWAIYRKTEIAAGRQPHNRRVSQLVREAIHQWKDRLIGPSPFPPILMIRTITVYLNPETLRILEWQARSCFKGNKSAALRMILIAVGYPRPVPVVIPKRRDKWYEAPE